jgi:hypothetical protein
VVSPAQVLERLGSSPAGLDAAEAARRLVEDGPNAVARNQRHHGWRILLSQFTSPLILVLIGAAIVSRYLGESVEATVIMGIVVVNAALGFVQEYRAERALRALQRFVTHSATVRRAGTLADVPSQDLVAGDVVCLEIGDMVRGRAPPRDRRPVERRIDADGRVGPRRQRVEPVSAGAALPTSSPTWRSWARRSPSGYGEGVVIATGAARAVRPFRRDGRQLPRDRVPAQHSPVQRLAAGGDHRHDRLRVRGQRAPGQRSLRSCCSPSPWRSESRPKCCL